MASLFFYVGGSAAAYWMGTNLLYRSANRAMDYFLNTKASSDIEGIYTVNSIQSMLETYNNLPDSHPAYTCMIEVKKSLVELQTAIERAQLRQQAHNSGYVTQFRTFDATHDNHIIDSKVKQLMKRIELFTQLLQLNQNY